MVSILLGSSDAETSGTFAPLNLICVDMPKIMVLFRSADMGCNLIEGILPVSSFVILPRSLGHEFDPQLELVLLSF